MRHINEMEQTPSEVFSLIYLTADVQARLRLEQKSISDENFN